MHRWLGSGVLLFTCCVLLTLTGCAGSLEDGYFRYPRGHLLFKVPPGEWQSVKEVPELFSPLVERSTPTAKLATRNQAAMILIWVKHTSRDLSRRRVAAFARLEGFLKRRRGAALHSGLYQYFEYRLQDEAIMATTDFTARAGKTPILGEGVGLFCFHHGDTYFYYAELLAKPAFFEELKAEFLKAFERPCAS